MTVTEEYLANNVEYQRRPSPVRSRCRRASTSAVVACTDARLDVYRILGLKDGEAHVIRNAGGAVTDDEIRLAGHQPAAAGAPGDHH